MAKQETNVKSVSDDELNDILTLPGSDNIITGEDKTKKSVFTNTEKETDKIIDDHVNETEEQKAKRLEEEVANKTKEEKDKEALAIKAKLEAEGEKILDENLTDEDDENSEEDLDEEEEKNGSAAGRKKLDRVLLVESLDEMVKEGLIKPFEGEKTFDKYTKQDVVDLFKANLQEKEEKLESTLKEQFFETLSPQLKHLAKFEYEGGKNLAPLLKAMLTVEEHNALDPKNEKDQESIVRNFLYTTEFGTPEEIEAEITSYKDKEELAKKAKQFKPKLDVRHTEQVQKEVKHQEEFKKKQQEATQNYVKSIGGILQKGELNGVKLDKKTQEMLYVGLTSPQYQSSGGGNTNLLGHLLEKYQVTEPRHDLVLETLWLLSDPEGYKAKIREIGAKDQGEKGFRKLKQAEENKGAGGAGTDTKDDDKLPKKKNNNVIKRPNIFSRT